MQWVLFVLLGSVRKFRNVLLINESVFLHCWNVLLYRWKYNSASMQSDFDK